MNLPEMSRCVPRRLHPLALAASAALTLLGGCVVAPAPYAVAPYPGPAVVATVPPPAPMVEPVGVAPYPGYIWISGFWGWGGGRYVWHGGHWAPPRPGYRWVPHRWVHQPDGWHGEGGRWERR